MSDAVLSVEIRARMTELSKGLKVAEDGIDNFVLRGNDSLKMIQQQFKAMGKTSKEIAANMNAAFKQISFKEVATGSANTKIALDQVKLSMAENRKESLLLKTEQQRLKSTMDETKKSILDADLAFRQGKVSEQEYRTETARLNAELKRLRLEQYQNRTANKALSGSYDEMRIRMTALGKEIRSAANGMDVNNEKVRASIAEYNRLNNALKKFDASIGNHQRNVGNYGLSLKGISAGLVSLAASYLSIYSAIASGKKIVDINKEIESTVVDVMRSTHMTREEIEKFKDSLKGLKTPTGLNDLLGISFIGGKLGVATEELLGFTKAADQLQLALGKEIGGDLEQTVEELGKIIAIYSEDGKITGDALQKVANGIIALAHAGVASAPYIVDFTKRLGGIEKISNVGLGASIGLGAGLEELGVSAEVGGTAVTQLLLKIGQDVPKYARLAGKSVEEFGKTLNTNAMEALIQMAEGLQKNKKGFEEISSSFAEAEAKGVRVAATLGVIGGNATLLREKIELSKTSLQGTAEITKAVDLRMNSLGGVMEQVGNKIKNSFISSGFANSLKDVIGRLAGVRSELDVLTSEVLQGTEAFNAQQDKLKPLLERYDELKRMSVLNSDEQDELKRVIVAIGEIIPGAISKIDQYGNALDINRGKVNALTEAQKELLRVQNQGAIQKANKQFDAISGARETDRNSIETGSVRLAAGGAGAVNVKVNAKLSGQIKDNIVLASGKMYEIAKQIQSMGGTLTKEQQAVINHFEKSSASLQEMRSWQAEYQKSLKETTATGSTGGGGNAKEVESIAKAYETLSTKLKQISADHTLTFGKKAEQEASAYKATINSLIAAGVDPLDNRIKELQATISTVSILNGKGVEAKVLGVKKTRKELEELIDGAAKLKLGFKSIVIPKFQEFTPDERNSIVSIMEQYGGDGALGVAAGKAGSALDKINEAFKNGKITLAEYGQAWTMLKSQLDWDETLINLNNAFIQFSTNLSETFGEAIGAILAGNDGFADFGKNMLQSVAKMMSAFGDQLVAFGVAAKAYAAAMAAVQSGNPAVMVPGATAAIIAGASLKFISGIISGIMSGDSGSSGSGSGSSAVKTIPRFAQGGIVSGPTLGLMGEYSGASSNPEVIAPLDKLTNMIRQAVAMPLMSTLNGSVGTSPTTASAMGSARQLGSTRPITIEVTGEFVQRGDDLVAAVEKGQKKNNRMFGRG